MSTSKHFDDRPWWQRRGPSALVFVGILSIMALASLAIWRDVAEVLPDVGKDQQGEDPWADPIGVEKVGGFRIAHIPDCAAAPVVRIELWDESTEPYWEVSGPPTPLSSFAIGVTPEGWTEDTPWKEPPDDEVVRLMVVRKVKGVAGVSLTFSDLRQGYVLAGDPIGRYEVQDFRTGSVCGGKDDKGETTTTSLLGG